MKTARPYELKERIYELCNEKQYFNAGSNEQYSMMFYAAASPQFSCRDVAIMIGICSVCADISKVEKELLDICQEIEKEVEEEEKEDQEETVYEAYRV